MSPPRRIARLLTTAVLGGLALVASTPAPASADPAGPSDFRSEVTGIEPDVTGVRAEIRGGDAFLELHVDRGHEVIVLDYSASTPKPYLRFR
jgi:hypothetical protein